MSSPGVGITTDSTEHDSMQDELSAMGQIAQILTGLSEETRFRVMRWIADRYRLAPATQARGAVVEPPSAASRQNAADESQNPTFADAANLFVAAAPGTAAEKALVLGYWLQVCKSEEDWDGYSVNTELKHMGHGLTNVTDALTSLINQRPQLVIQTRKSGKARQARKQYRLTLEGVRKVKQMITSVAASEREAQHNE